MLFMLAGEKAAEVDVPEKDLEVTTMRSGGAGILSVLPGNLLQNIVAASEPLRLGYRHPSKIVVWCRSRPSSCHESKNSTTYWQTSIINQPGRPTKSEWTLRLADKG